jgi:hypothetical protein
MGTAAVEEVGLTHSSFFPANSSYDAFGSRFTWHPLLQTVPIRNATLAKGRIHHNSLGMRGPEQKPESLSGKALIALFGGSTTYDIALAEGKTWPDRLVALLGSDHYTVLKLWCAWIHDRREHHPNGILRTALRVTPDLCGIF